MSVAATCADPHPVHTIGHSTREIEGLLGLLGAHSVDVVVDVRRWPASRRHPHFARQALEASLATAGIAYVWRRDLGGFRTPAPDSPNIGWRVKAFRGYADFMLTPEFERSMAEVEALAGSRRIALMCAEALPSQCHRRLLADAFMVRGWSVRHVLDGGCAAHQLTPFACPSGTRILYLAARTGGAGGMRAGRPVIGRAGAPRRSRPHAAAPQVDGGRCGPEPPHGDGAGSARRGLRLEQDLVADPRRWRAGPSAARTGGRRRRG